MASPRKIVLGPTETFTTGPRSGLAMSEDGKLVFAGVMHWFHMRHVARDDIAVPLLADGDTGRPYYEEHWVDAVALAQGKSGSVSALAKRVRQGEGHWLGPPDDAGRRIPLAFHLLQHAFSRRISDRVLAGALGQARYASLEGPDGTLLDLALQLRLFHVARSLWDTGARPGKAGLEQGKGLAGLAWPRAVGDGAMLSDVLERLAGPKPQRKPVTDEHEDDARVVTNERIQVGWQHLISETKTWIERLDDCGCSWEAQHAITLRKDDGHQSIKLPWFASLFFFRMRDYHQNKGIQPGTLNEHQHGQWQQMWMDFADRLPPAVLLEPRCHLDTGPLSAIEVIRQQGYGEQAAALEKSALERSVSDVALQRKMARL